MMQRKQKLRASLLVTICVLGSWALPCHAEDKISPAKLLLEPTFECMGVEVSYTGDDNFNASGTLRYRAAGESKWRQGHPLVRVSDKSMDAQGKGASNPRFFSSIFYLRENTEYEVEATVADADGVTAPLPPQKMRTRNSRVPTGGGKEYYVDPAAGENGDGSKGRAFNSLKQAFEVGGPGDTVHLAKGVYLLNDPATSARSGDETSWLHYRGEPGAVVTDADPKISGVGKLAWEKFKQDADGRWIYKLPVQNAHRVMVRKTPGDVTTGYFLWRFMKNDGTKYNGPHRGQTLDQMVENYAAVNECGAFLQEPDALYVVLPKGMDDPAKTDVQISVGQINQKSNNHTLAFSGHHVLVEGITFDLTASLQVRGGHDVYFRRIAMYGNNDSRSMGTGVNGLVEDSTFVFNAGYDWAHSPPAKTTQGNRWDPWGKIKNGLNDTHLITPERSTVLRYNLMSGFNNVIQTPAPERNRNIDVSYNLIEHAYDDCVEPDGPGINWRVHDNHFRHFFNGISDAPVSVGPFFVVRNMFQGYMQAAFKVRNKAAGPTIYYHNAVYPQKNLMLYGHGSRPDVWPIPNPGYDGMAFCPDQDGERWMRTRNNILIGGSTAYSLRNGGKNVLLGTLDFDYNALATVGGGKITRVGEQHSIEVLPKFMDLDKGDMRLAKAGDPCVDAGQIVKGINDEVPEPYQYKGKSPDIGIAEFGAPLPHYGPRKAEAPR